MIWRRILLFWISGWLLHLAAETGPDDARTQALESWRSGKRDEAVALISRAIGEHPKDARLLNMRSQMRLLLKDGPGAINDLDEAIRLEPELASLRQDRASLLFQAGKLAAACADFDKANELSPRLVPLNWRRGIALYYAGRYADGRRQFESHQTANSADVENAAWHFLCVAKSEGIAEAKRNLIRIEGDERIPMREIQRLYEGKGTVAEVFAAATAGEPGEAQRREREFYAHLYVGLYFEANGDAAKTKEHILKAAALAESGNYMGDVARVHAALLQLTKTESSPKQP